MARAARGAPARGAPARGAPARGAGRGHAAIEEELPEPPAGQGAGRGRGAGRAPGRGALAGRGAGIPHDLTESEIVFTNLGFPQPVIDFLINQEFIRSLSDFLTVQKDVIDKIFTRMDNAEIAYSAAIHLSLMKFLHSYVRRMDREGRLINLAMITVDVLRREQDFMDDSKTSTDLKSTEPDKFLKESKWRAFKDLLRNHLDGIKGAKNINLSYVLRPVIPPEDYNHDDAMYTAELFGRLYLNDNNRVFTILERLTLGGPGETFVSNFKANRDGRGAFLQLDTLYSGGAYQSNKITSAWKAIQEAKYTGKKPNFDFAQYRRVMDEAWRDLSEASTAGERISDSTKVTFLINGIEGPEHRPLRDAVKTTPRLMESYEAACIHIATCLINSETLIVPRARNVSQLSTRSYSRDEWAELSQESRDKIVLLRNSQAHRGGGGGRGHSRGGRTGGRGGNRGGRQPGRGRGSSSASQQPRRTLSTSVPQGSILRRAKISRVASHNNDYYEDDPYEYGDDEELVYDASDVHNDGEIEPRIQQSSKTARFSKVRRVSFKPVYVKRNITISTTRINKDDLYSHAELDSHADHSVLGSDATILEEYMGETFRIYGYRKEDGFVERHVVKAALAYDLDNGSTVILIFDQVFVDSNLDHSLINPNQLRDFGLDVQDTPKIYNSSSRHSIKIPGADLEIPLMSKGYISCFPVRKATEEELIECTHVEVTANVWDPHFPNSEDELIAGISTSGTFAIDPTVLAKRLLIPKQTALDTLLATTVLASRVRGDEPQYAHMGNRFRWLSKHKIEGRFFSDTFFGLPSLSGVTCFQIFANEYRFVYCFPMKTKSDAPSALRRFIDDIGIPDVMVTDNSLEQTGREWTQCLRKFGIKGRTTEAYQSHQNYAENCVKLVKFRTVKLIEQCGIPTELWDHVLLYAAALNNVIVHAVPRLQNRTPFEYVFGKTPDISSFVDHKIYDYVWHIVSPKPRFPEPRRVIGRFLGPSKTITSDLSYKVLAKSGRVIVTSSVQPVTVVDLDNQAVIAQIKDYDLAISSNFKGSSLDLAATFDIPPELHPSTVGTVVRMGSLQACKVDRAKVTAQVEIKEIDVARGASVDQRGWESARITVGDDRKRVGIVRGKKRDADGEIVGSFDTNPILDTTVYNVEMEDGLIEEIAANSIAESIYQQTDPEGRKWLELDSIVEHFQSKTLSPKTPKAKSTKGHFFLVKWKDGTTDVVRLSDVKESYPVEVAEYAKANGLDELPAFKWWVPYTLKRSKRIISIVKARNVRMEKFGILIPRNCDEALKFDAESGTTYWRDAIDREQRNVNIAFDFRDKAPPGYQKIRCHWVFDIKIDGTRKARFVGGGHLTETPSSICYSSVVSRDSIRILLVVAALNGLDLSACDIQNAYLTAFPREKVYFVAGSEFGDNHGRVVVVVRALYGLKSSGAAFRSKLAETLREMGYFPSQADPDVWMRPRNKPDGTCFYEYVLTYVDDVLCISDDPSVFMKKFSTLFTLKAGYSTPSTFLGAEILQYELSDKKGRRYTSWGLGSSKYLSNIIVELEKKLLNLNLSLPATATAPITSGYHPENDITPLLDEADIGWYQGLIGTLRWLVEIGRIDIMHSCTIMSTYLQSPREGHLLELFHIFSYLKKHMNYSLILDPEPLPFNGTLSSQQADWSDFYHDVKEAIPPNAPKPRGQPVETTFYVDADHANDTSNRRSHSGILGYVQGAPVLWYSKKQATVESSTHGSELVATRIAVEFIESIRYKLRMFGVPILGPTILLCDNMSVVHNGTRPESTLKKKHNSISYHKLRESVAAGYVELHKVHTSENLADLLTKILSGVTTANLVANILVKV